MAGTLDVSRSISYESRLLTCGPCEGHLFPAMQRMTVIFQIGIGRSCSSKATDQQRVVPKCEFSATDVSGSLRYGCLRIRGQRIQMPLKWGAGQALARDQPLRCLWRRRCCALVLGGLFTGILARCLSTPASLLASLLGGEVPAGKEPKDSQASLGMDAFPATKSDQITASSALPRHSQASARSDFMGVFRVSQRVASEQGAGPPEIGFVFVAICRL